MLRIFIDFFFFYQFLHTIRKIKSFIIILKKSKHNKCKSRQIHKFFSVNKKLFSSRVIIPSLCVCSLSLFAHKSGEKMALSIASHELACKRGYAKRRICRLFVNIISSLRQLCINIPFAPLSKNLQFIFLP